LVWRVERRVGDRVKRGDVLAVIDAAEVGRAKAEYAAAVGVVDARTRALARLRQSAGDVPSRSVAEAEASVAEATAQLLGARQALAAFGLTVANADFAGMSPADVAEKVRFLGLPDDLAGRVAADTRSSNLLAVRSPIDGEVTQRSVTPGETADPSKVQFVVTDVTRVWLMLAVRGEDADRLAVGLPVHFRHPGHADADAGTVTWVSPAVDERTRTVAVRVELNNRDGRHAAGTFGRAEVVLRDEPNAVVVPSEAVHWEGDCHVVFVRDKGFDSAGSPKVFHVRTVKPGVSAGGRTELIAGVLPGELVATRQSGVLRSELLKADLGEG
jgi:cobalt-zinc-cadmium efflux system membrane fusion protein